MNDMTPTSGHNMPPDPLDEALAPYGDSITEAEGWLDGQEVTDEGQMKAVDILLKEIKAAHKEVSSAQKSEAAPLHDAWKDALARYKPTLEDLDRIKKGLVSLLDGFKRKLAAEKAEAERKARAEADRQRREAEEKAREAAKGDIEAQREAAAAQRAAEEAQKAAAAVSKEQVKGLRKVTRYEITDHKDALHDIARHDREAITAFIEEYVRRNHKARPIAGVRVWDDREAF